MITITTTTTVETLDDFTDALAAIREIGIDTLTVSGTIDYTGAADLPTLLPQAVLDELTTLHAAADDAPYGWTFRHQCIEMLERSYAVEPGSIFGLVGGLHVQLTALAPYVENVAMAATYKATPTSFSVGRGAAAKRQGVEMQRRWPDLDLATTVGWLLDAGCQLAHESSDEADAS